MIINRPLRYWWPLGVAFLAVYLLVYLCAVLVPFHSDDYSYFLQGLSVETRINHYFNWSGRLITDFTSSYLLNLFSRPVYMAINSLVVVLMLFSISVLPQMILQKPLDRTSTVLIFGVVFMSYWVGNPSLGQTSFWVVGSANYVWPLMWASFYLLCLFYSIGKKNSPSPWTLVLLVVLGFLAGLSNEATGISVTFLTFVLLIVHRQKAAYVLTALISNLAGFLVLYLAPGNYVRLTQFAESKWSSLGFFERVFVHLVKRMPTALMRYWFAIVVVILVALLLRRHRNKVQSLWAQPEVRYGCGFVLLSLFSVLVFLPSPAMPARAMNTALYFLLIAIALFSSLLLGPLKQYALKGYAWLMVFCAVFFVTSYALFHQSVANAEIQQEIREDIIAQARLQGQDVVNIPDWYFTRLLKRRDAIDAHRNGSMEEYYGLKKIHWTPAYFNYAILKNTQPLITDVVLTPDLNLVALYEYHEFAASKDGLVVGFDHDLSQYAVNIYGQFYLELHTVKGNMGNYVINTQENTQIGDEYYYWLPIKRIKASEIKELFVGFKAENVEKEKSVFRIKLL